MTEQPPQGPPGQRPAGAAARLAASVAAAQAEARAGMGDGAAPEVASVDAAAARVAGPGAAIPPPVPSSALRATARPQQPRPTEVPPRHRNPTAPAPTKPEQAAPRAPTPQSLAAFLARNAADEAPLIRPLPSDDTGSVPVLDLDEVDRRAGRSSPRSEPLFVPPSPDAAVDRASAAAGDGGTRPPSPPAVATRLPDAPAATEAPARAATDLPRTGADPAGPNGGGAPPAASEGRPRFVALYVAMAVLFVAVPALGWFGSRALRTSHNGTLLTGSSDPNGPGYEGLVEPTPTALVVQLGADKKPVSLTVLSLSGPGHKGGAVVSVPLDLQVTTKSFGVQVVSDAFTHGGVPTLAGMVRRELTIGFDEVITVDTASLAELIRPIGGLELANPVDVTSPDGTDFPSGQLTLTPREVGAYLQAVDAHGDELNQLDRQGLVWQAWLSAVHASKKATVVPGEGSTGMGRFVRGLAAGQFDIATLPVTPLTDDPSGAKFALTKGLSRLLLTNAVPFPVSGSTAQRVTVRVLNASKPGSVPQSVLQRIVYAGGQLSVLGNYKRFGVGSSHIEYSAVGNLNAVKRIAAQLHIHKLVPQPNVGDSINVTVVLGNDLIGSPPALLTAAGVGS